MEIPMILLPVPLPPNWEVVVGWTGGDHARWLSGYWTSLGDHPYLSDGRTSMSGDGYGWLAWSRSRAVAPHLADYRLGDSMSEGPHALLIDRAERRVYAADRHEADCVVLGQWPACEEPDLTVEQVEAVMDRLERAMAARPMPTVAQLMASMREHSRLVSEMVKWLDQWKEGK
jgi:hypothetical protein